MTVSFGAVSFKGESSDSLCDEVPLGILNGEALVRAGGEDLAATNGGGDEMMGGASFESLLEDFWPSGVESEFALSFGVFGVSKTGGGLGISSPSPVSSITNLS